MPYVGKNPTIGNFVKLDAIVTSATATYNLLNGGVAYSPQSANHCLVSLNGVIQSPNTSFTISGSTIVFASALTATDVIDFILILGDVLNIGTPSDATVGFAKVTSNLITGATAETSIAGGDSVLIFDDSASALRKMTRTNFVSGLANTPAFFAYPSTSTNVSNNTNTKVTFNTEAFDTDNCFDSSTNHRFTPTTAGKYFCFATVTFGSVGATFSAYDQMRILFYKNGSQVQRLIFDFQANPLRYGMLEIQNIITFNGTTDYLEVFMFPGMNTDTPQIQGDTSVIPTYFGAYKLIGV